MDINQLKCPMCGGRFNSQQDLDFHAKQMHDNKEGQQEEHLIMCSKCGMKSKSTQDFEAHHQQHSTNS